MIRTLAAVIPCGLSSVRDRMNPDARDAIVGRILYVDGGAVRKIPANN
jgi:hypothetical protein